MASRWVWLTKVKVNLHAVVSLALFTLESALVPSGPALAPRPLMPLGFALQAQALRHVGDVPRGSHRKGVARKIPSTRGQQTAPASLT